ncbi:hypothetical protein MRS44_009096 [Fusarium solani]|uniref:uncharacterized protein n=1 Tax=Fusarium solani TaxID=169388 RepID=UPI0032C4984D|nr:hypothetical protein MRS44_009096 [Fusarium solani]
MAISSAAPQIPPLQPSSPIFQQTRAALAAIMPADFDKQSYWHKRFASEKAFEWLVKSADFMPLVEPVLERLEPATARILHIGFGTSDLQNHFRARGFRNLLNVDYEPLAIDRGRELETQAFGDVQMRYEVQDATQLDLKEKFDLIVDKSTVDAISCAGETPYVVWPPASGIVSPMAVYGFPSAIPPRASTLMTCLLISRFSPRFPRPNYCHMIRTYTTGAISSARSETRPSTHPPQWTTIPPGKANAPARDACRPGIYQGCIIHTKRNGNTDPCSRPPDFSVRFASGQSNLTSSRGGSKRLGRLVSACRRIQSHAKEL